MLAQRRPISISPGLSHDDATAAFGVAGYECMVENASSLNLKLRPVLLGHLDTLIFNVRIFVQDPTCGDG
jgi:hypothetical protein